MLLKFFLPGGSALNNYPAYKGLGQINILDGMETNILSDDYCPTYV
jgi:hypothetical protein